MFILPGLSLNIFFSGKNVAFILNVIIATFIYFLFRGEENYSSWLWHLGMKKPHKEESKFEHRISQGLTQEKNRIHTMNSYQQFVSPWIGKTTEHGTQIWDIEKTCSC